MKLVDFEDVRRELTPEQLAEAQMMTKKRANLYKIIAVITLLCGGIGLLLPFGKLAQLYTIGYAGLCGKRAFGNAAGWAYTGLLMSILMGLLGKVFPSLITPRFLYPAE